MSLNNDTLRHYVLTSKQEFDSWKTKQDKTNLEIVKPNFSKLFGDET